MPNVTFKFTPEQANRIQEAFSNRRGVSATPPEIKDEIIDYIRKVVHHEERAAAARAFVPGPDVEIT